MGMQKITHKRITEIVEGYPMLKTLTGIKLTYAITKNMKMLKAEIENLNESRYTSDDLKAYQEEYRILVTNEAKKDKDGNFIQIGQGQIAIEDMTGFTQKVNDLNKRYKKELEKVKDETEKFNKFYNEPIELNFYTFKSDVLPENITVEQRELLTEMEEDSD
jgi:hypothetical protein